MQLWLLEEVEEESGLERGSLLNECGWDSQDIPMCSLTRNVSLTTTVKPYCSCPAFAGHHVAIALAMSQQSDMEECSFEFKISWIPLWWLSCRTHLVPGYKDCYIQHAAHAWAAELVVCFVGAASVYEWLSLSAQSLATVHTGTWLALASPVKSAGTYEMPLIWANTHTHPQE